MECPICYNLICDSAIGSCTHHFCYNCIIQWCQFGGTKCPICKISITHIRPDTEFDILNRKISKVNKTIIKNNLNILVINFEKDDIILFINNIPCIDHSQAIHIVNRCVISSDQMTCSLLKIRKI